MGKLLTIDEWKRKAINKHGSKYDYSKVNYINANTKVCIVCPIHGEFWQKPGMHLLGNGCPKCNKSCKIDTNTFIERARQIHDNKYNYSKVEYTNNKTKVCIICPIHGEFWQKPNDHLSGHGCHKCNCHNHTKDFSNFITLANKVHSNKYTYTKDSYINRETKTKITCPEHGDFFQEPRYHLQGNGCPECGNKCNVSEKKILDALLKKFSDDDIVYQYKNNKLLGLMSFDIYFPKYKIAVEHQGIQHFEPVKRFGGVKKLEETKKRDKLKKKICDENGITVIYISLDPHVVKYSSENMEILKTTEELFSKIIFLKNKVKL